MILIFQFGFAVINPSGNSYKQVLTSKHASNAAALGSIIAAAAIFICFFPSLAAEKTFEDDILFNVYLADSYIQDMIAKFSDSFDSDIITIDYRVRGFTRNTDGKKLFIDHKITSIQDYIKDETLKRYDTVDINVYQANIFHTQMLIKELELQNYLFKTDVYEIPPKERLAISNSLRREMIEIFSGSNVYNEE